MQTVKIVVTGPFSSGKTEFIRSVSEIDVVSTERKISSDAEKIKETTTVAMDFGRITVDDDLVLYLFGTPGQHRFDFMWEILSEGMLGFIVMVDSTRPETFREARSILETFRAYAPTPYVVAANKQDRPDAWDIDDMRVALRLDPKVKLLPCVARKKDAVKSSCLNCCTAFWPKWTRPVPDRHAVRGIYQCHQSRQTRELSITKCTAAADRSFYCMVGWVRGDCGRKR